MSANLLNFRNPRAALSLSLVVFFHAVALLCWQLQSRQVWLADKPVFTSLPTSMPPGAWQQFFKTLGPLDDIREDRLSINRVRIHTKYGCYELEQTAAKRLDLFNWSPQFVTNCRY